jgi:uncharacterized cofD-like protein
MTNLSKLLRPGMNVKRWLLLIVLGLLLISLGFGYFLTNIYREQPLPEFAATVTLQFISRPVRGLLFVAFGIPIFIIGLLKLSQSLLGPFVGNRSVVDAIYSYRLRERGPKVVVIGGGTGLSVALRGLKAHTSNLTAIVTVADDGGSSGRLRRDLGVLPPGDFRNCMVALADVEPLMENLFQYRFNHGSELEGHSFGNLFIVAMSEVTGNFERALEESSRVLAVRGRVIPSTLADVTLCAETDDAETVQGESSITAAGHRIRRVFLKPDPPAYPAAIKAIMEADLIVIGPGSLYTSVLPNLVVHDIGKALVESPATKIYVCNVATQPGETDGYGIGDHIEALLKHLGAHRDPFDLILANERLGLPMPASGRVMPVSPNGTTHGSLGARLVLEDIVDEDNAVRHDSVKLAQAIMRIYADGGDRGKSRAKAAQYV